MWILCVLRHGAEYGKVKGKFHHGIVDAFFFAQIAWIIGNKTSFFLHMPEVDSGGVLFVMMMMSRRGWWGSRIRCVVFLLFEIACRQFDCLRQSSNPCHINFLTRRGSKLPKTVISTLVRNGVCYGRLQAIKISLNGLLQRSTKWSQSTSHSLLTRRSFMHENSFTIRATCQVCSFVDCCFSNVWW